MRHEARGILSVYHERQTRASEYRERLAQIVFTHIRELIHA